MVQVKRIYDSPADSDGYRVLVDRLWPRGVSKERAQLQLWLKDVAPTPQLRTWFAHDPKKFAEFQKRYKQELKDNPALPKLRDIIKQHGTVTLLYGAKDTRINHAVVLKEMLT